MIGEVKDRERVGNACWKVNPPCKQTGRRLLTNAGQREGQCGGMD
jgi:hypothetical protein